ncbi:hypothetical protein IJ750_07460 [bacterium]|nr:hypothetical protein [bacterium]
MQQLLPQREILIPDTCEPQKAVEYINSYIKQSECPNLSVDISFMNIIDACYVSTMCSTSHYVKYPEGKVSWLVSSKLTEEFTKDLGLGNSEFWINN